MESIQSMVASLHQGEFPVLDKHQGRLFICSYLSSMLGDTYYQFVAPPLVKPPGILLGAGTNPGITIGDCCGRMDDIILLVQYYSSLKDNMKITIDTLKFRWILNFKNSALIPTMCLEY